MTIGIDELIMIGVGLISLFSPPSNIGPFASICGRFSKTVQRQIALRVFLFYCVAGLLCVWVGHWLFLLLGLKASSVMATGGLVLLIKAGLPMTLHADSPRKIEDDVTDIEEGANWKKLVAVPLVFPVSFGGAAAAYLVAEASHFGSFVDKLAISAVCIVCGLVVFCTVALSATLSSKMTEGHRDILTRLSGIVLTALSFQLLVRGLTELALTYGLEFLSNQPISP